MTERQKQEIEYVAERFLRDQDAFRLPVDVDALTKKLGIKVIRMSFNEEPVTGMIVVDDDKPIPHIGAHRLISVNEALDKEQTRFIIAHELGHFKLHKMPVQTLITYRDTDEPADTQVEAEAEFFARALLMPKAFMELAVRKFQGNFKKHHSIQSFIGQIFEVSLPKAYKRLLELKMLE